VVGEVRRHVRVGFIALDEHPVFVVTEPRRRQPKGAIALVGVAALRQFHDDLLYRAGVVEARLPDERVEADARAL
jgi:hypothetical protein